MSEAEILSAARDLEALLTVEREALMAGRAREAADLSDSKLAALQVFEAALGASSAAGLSGQGRQTVLAVVRMSEENSRLFSAVRNGLRSLIERFEKPSEEAFVGCYRQGGAAVPFTKATGSYQKKI